MFKVIAFSLISISLLGCGVKNEDPAHIKAEERTANIKMAEAKNIKPTIHDPQIKKLVKEAEMIEDKIDQLTHRLNILKDRIFDRSGIEMAQNKISETPQIEIVQKDSDTPNTTFSDVPSAPMMEKSMMDSLLKKSKPEKPKSHSPTIQSNIDLPVKERPQQNKMVMNVEKKEAKPVKIVKPIKTAGKGNGVYNVRHGVHPNKTRLVFDINGSTNHTISFDKEVGLLTVTLPNTQWTSAKNKTYKSSQITGYEAKPTGKGVVIAIAVKNTSNAKAFSLSKPNRLIVDLMK